jgi:AraC family transcriptional regulator
MSCELTARWKPAFFGFSASKELAVRLFGPRLVSLGTIAVVVATTPSWSPDPDLTLSNRTSVAAYPGSVDALFALILGQEDGGADQDKVDVLIPKEVFLELADRAGADHPTKLSLGVGWAAGDPVVIALQECFLGLRAMSTDDADAMAERLVDSMNIHLAERYGDMRRSVTAAIGGLAPWQLRVAQRSLNDLQSTASLDDVASECGLSTGHFARAFKHSTGRSPHQWAVLRRIEAAKEMMTAGVPLAEIAVACRFSDQSHMTRAFAQITGITPGRWRSGQAREHAMS